ncbi:hypothetical protein BS50DRAFT_632272 [Corynespora cassiicola Philippines]|uniref:Uncharacterized protein n=1 Tax=Corynespora cassiicola Philippines TaxID=1448308 RepID=A0A2T2NYE1_CORCC|nr:hypothetical protein BS50DRAFT_632272 [Corynespora cassiicola Philippines]
MVKNEQRESGAVYGDGRLLASPPLPSDEFSRSRSSSIARSFQSTPSKNITAEGNKPASEIQQSFRRQRTYKFTAKLTLWDRFKGLFNPQALLDKVGDSVETVCLDISDEEMFDHRNSPYIITIAVSPKIRGNKHSEARCMLDTGCIQGNIVSSEFVRELGFEESDFKKLTQREEKGGKSASGHIIVPKGAVYLSWHHGSSGRYRDMRFLVAPNVDFDIIIGSRALTKYDILSPPNFGSVGARMWKNDKDTDEEYDKLRSDEAKLKSEFENLEEELKDAKDEKPQDQGKIKDLKKRVKGKKVQWKIKDLEAEKHKNNKLGQTKEAEQIQEEIDELKNPKPKNKKDKKQTKNVADEKKKKKTNNASEP